MSNIKSWADASSDEESDDDARIAPPPSGLPGSSSYGHLQQAEESEEEDFELPPRFDISQLPDRGPYTAFLGNLPFDVRDSNDLGEELMRMFQSRPEPECKGIQITDARLMLERDTGRPKGFGYVEFAKAQEILTFLNLYDVKLMGRAIKVDLAETQGRGRGGGDRGGGRQSERGSRGGGGRDRGGGGGDRDGMMMRGPRGDSGRDMRDSRGDSGRGMRNDSRGNLPKIDGSSFRAARGLDNRGSMSGPGGGGGGGVPTIMKRNESSGSGGLGGEGGGPRQRPSLKLLARTKPVEGAAGAQSTSRSSIFGDAKPRDETKITAKKESSKGDVTASVKSVAEKMEKVDLKEQAGDAAADAPKKLLEKQKPLADSLDDGYADMTFGEAPAAAKGSEKERDGEASRDSKSSGKNIVRKDSKSGRGGRGEGGGGRGKGRKESSRKSGRGGRSGGRRENSDRGGRGGDNKRGSKSTKGGGKDGGKDGGKEEGGKDKGTSGGSSLAAAAAAPKEPQPPVQEQKRAPPKKVNSFAAFMDDDSD